MLDFLIEVSKELCLTFFLLQAIDPSVFSVNLLLLFTLGSRLMNKGGFRFRFFLFSQKNPALLV